MKMLLDNVHIPEMKGCHMCMDHQETEGSTYKLLEIIVTCLMFRQVRLGVKSLCANVTTVGVIEVSVNVLHQTTSLFELPKNLCESRICVKL